MFSQLSRVRRLPQHPCEQNRAGLALPYQVDEGPVRDHRRGKARDPDPDRGCAGSFRAFLGHLHERLLLDFGDVERRRSSGDAREVGDVREEGVRRPERLQDTGLRLSSYSTRNLGSTTLTLPRAQVVQQALPDASHPSKRVPHRCCCSAPGTRTVIAKAPSPKGSSTT